MFFDIITDAAMDSMKILPFLFLAFLILELLEQYSGKLNQALLVRFRKAGPLLGALLGCIPECGIPILGANLFAASLISPGTLLAVFLSSSDEALLILLGLPAPAAIIPNLLITKIIIAVICGYITDLFFASRLELSKTAVHDSHSCGHCEHSHNPFIHALQHTMNLFCYIFIFTLALNLLLEIIGFSNLASLLLKDSVFQPILTSLVGLIPNCAASILLTKLYAQGILSFAAFISGLCAGTGLGSVILLKACADKKQVLKLLGILWGFSALSGMLLSILG